MPKPDPGKDETPKLAGHGVSSENPTSDRKELHMQIMTAPQSGDQPTKMSSREIAVLTDKRHDHVKRDIETMLRDLGEDIPKFGGIYLDSMNREQTEYLLDRELTETLLTGYSAVLRRKVIARWRELEFSAVPAPLNMRDPAQVVVAALQLIEVNQEQRATIEAQQRQIDDQSPKVAALERIALSDGSLCITDAAKTVQMPPRRFTQMLQAKHWIYRRPMGSGWLAYQDRIQAGLLEHKLTTGEKSDGHEWSNTQVRITAKGLTKLAALVNQDGMH